MKSIQNYCRETDSAANEISHNFRNVVNTEFDDEIPALTVSTEGTITNCNGSCASLFGCLPSEVVHQNISKFLPQIQDIRLLEGHHLNPRLHFFSHIGYHFQMIKCTGVPFDTKVFFVELGNTFENFIRLIIRPVKLEAKHS